jgi:YidC/Oxa1 family membrane protein insertase
MERRVLLAVFLSFLVLMVYQTFVVKPRTKPGASGARPATATTPPPGEGTVTPAPSQTAGIESASPAQPAPEVSVGAAKEQEVVVETETVRAVFSNRGAVLKSWLLKHYLDSAGKPMDLVPPAMSDVSRLPFSISVADAALTARMNTALYQSSAEALSLGAQSGTLRFTYRDATGLSVAKSFDIQPGGQPYVLRVTTDVRLDDQPVRVATHGGAGFGDIERGVQQGGFLAVSTYQPPQAIFQMGSDVSRIRPDSIGQQPAYEGPMRYAGVDDQYFLAALVSSGKQTRVEYRPLTINTSGGPRTIVDYHVRVAGSDPLTFFYGPKEFDQLQKVDPELVRTIHFGIFGFLATPLLKSLKWLNGSVGNYGWSIILLTVIINLLMFPLRHKSAVSMRKMQEIQPQVKAIQDRYAKLKVTDPARQKMNTELMNLYRERGVNPASGCVPMLLTFPVLFAFYALLSVAIELRGAPWVGWIQDLSTHDPYYVTPILMGISQFWQTRMMPATGDPTQQRVMMLMPLMFLVFFLWAPSGLVIYWLVSNVWTIGQQYLTNHLIASKPAARAAAR